MISILVMGCEKGKEVTISYNSTLEGAPNIQAMKVERGSIIEEPEYVESFTYNEKEYQFLGWYDDNGQFDFSQPIEVDTKLNASWKTSVRTSTLLVDLSSNNFKIFKSVSIVKIDSHDKYFSTDALFHNVYTRYNVTVESNIYKTYERGYVNILGGEESPHIYKWYDFHFLEFVEPKPNEYYLMISTFDDEDEWKIIGHGLIKLDTYDSNKDLLEQDEDTLSIILPYIEEAEKHKE